MNATTETPRELDKIEAYRKDEFEGMKFSSHEATQMATARDTKYGGYTFDVHRIRKMLKQGCSHKMVFRIFG